MLDFGVAKQTRLPAMGGLTTDGKVVGTPEFMSPEMVLEDDPLEIGAERLKDVRIWGTVQGGRIFEAPPAP